MSLKTIGDEWRNGTEPSNLFSVRNFIGGVLQNYRDAIRGEGESSRATNESSVRIKTNG